MKKIVAVFSSLDGGGGAGLLADCRAVAAVGCRPLAVALGVSSQNLDAFFGLWRVPPGVVVSQFAALAGAQVSAVKVGMLAGNDAAVGRCIKLIHKNYSAPVVWDPVVSPTAPMVSSASINATRGLVDSRLRGNDGGGGNDGTKKLLKRQPPLHGIFRARRTIAPYVFVATPNRQELLTITGAKTINDGLRMLFDDGIKNVLITGMVARRMGSRGFLRHCLYCADTIHSPLWEVVVEKRRGEFHGSGCLFSSLLAAYLARGYGLARAAARANDKTLAAIDKAALAKNRVRGWGRRQYILSQ